MKEEVLGFIEENNPVELEAIEDEFGQRGLRSVKTLMQHNEVSFTIDWKIQVEP